MASIRMAFGRTIRRFRKEAGYSQEGFALRAKIDRGYMGRIERGEVNLSLDNIQKLAKSLGVSVGALMTAVSEAME